MCDSINSLDSFVECSVLTSAITSSARIGYHTCPISSTMTYSKFALDPLNRSARYSPLSFDRTVPTTLIPSSRNASTVWLTVNSYTTLFGEGTYTAMKPDAPVTSTFDPDLIAGIIAVVVCTDDRW